MKINCAISKGCLIALILFPGIALSDEQQMDVFLFREQKDQDVAYGASLFVGQEQSKWVSTNIGLSVSTVSSDSPIESGDRHRIYPLHGFLGLSYGKPVAIYGEFGADVGEIMTSEIFGGEGGSIDFYYCAGLKTAFNHSLNLSVYAKLYRIYYFDDIKREDMVKSLRMVGVGIGINY
ncbi:MAG: hypothetical protein OEY67_07190 [Gammaproteobacteria bacterium]|nr:hypothetical protein [Gammaproteobacteria bacterium]